MSSRYELPPGFGEVVTELGPQFSSVVSSICSRGVQVASDAHDSSLDFRGSVAAAFGLGCGVVVGRGPEFSGLGSSLRSVDAQVAPGRHGSCLGFSTLNPQH